MFYTYAHSTPQGRLFYIGKGHGRRAYIFHKRNNHWNNIVKKYGKPTVQILADWKTEAEAFDHEKFLIACFKDMGYDLSNLTDGGDGATGLQHSQEFKNRLSKIHKGNKWRLGLPTSAKQKAISSAIFKGNKYAAGNTAQRKWIWVGTHIETGEVIRLIGEKALKDGGFQHSNIIKCINGYRKSHKGYTWHKEYWEGK